MADKDNEIEVYKAYFDLRTKTREERTAYDRHFLSLLFIDYLVGVFTTVLSATTVTAFPALPDRLEAKSSPSASYLGLF